MQPAPWIAVLRGACVAMRYALVSAEVRPTSMRPTPQAGHFPCSMNLRITLEQKVALEQAYRLTPGCASPSGAARRAIDEFIERTLGHKPSA